ncbi:transcription factor domain-containing protein [Aspergillus stella-maris]|uniref:transcription factor domain-containing protein n=1 Tax=Aspergillus stella-maris TaxID=1810926 RepID=UPI003CCCF8B4
MERGARRYMSKAQRACDGCRTRKSACQIDLAPPCRLCRAHGQPCEFTSRVKRKQSLTRSPSSGLPDYEASTNQWENGIDAASGSQINNNIFDDFMFTSPNVEQSYETSSDTHSRLRSLDNLDGITAELCGLTGDMDPFVLQHYSYNADSELAFSKLAVRQVQRSVVPTQFLLSRQEPSSEEAGEPGFASAEEALRAIVPPEVGGRLISLFFRFIQPQFPLLSDSSRPSPTTSPTHLLAAIYCLAQFFASFDDYLCVELVYTPPSTETLTNIAWRGLHQSTRQHTITTVQTALILLLQSSARPLDLESSRKWALMGMTISISQSLGLHLDPGCWNLPESEIAVRRNLSWLVYTFDKWFAFSLGRPSHICRDDWLVTDVSRAEPTMTGPNLPNFLKTFSTLTMILDNTLRDLYSVRASAALTRDFRLAFEKSRPLLEDLARWAESAPASKVHEGRRYEGFAPLHIAYHAVKCLILRALLHPFNHTDCLPSPEDKEEWDAAKAHMRRSAKAEIEAALVRISTLDAVDYQSFWAPWYKSCFAVIIHLIFVLAVSSFKNTKDCNTNQVPEMDPEYQSFRTLLDQARTEYRLHSKSLDVIQLALLRIDAVFWIGWENVLGFP